MEQRRVRVLPEDLANRIAAGEVVERPASVVKELVENAVDAGASHVRVQVEEAGKALVRVEDDGEGMTREDALLALQRHATSKISCAEDLDRIFTLGFRGEALPSIASVSRLSLTTRTADAAEGARIRVEGGRLLSQEVAGAAKGTTVEVRDLFFNVPARRKFLKADATELRNIAETLTLLALVNAGVGFELRSGSRLLLAVPAGLDLEARVAELVGGETPSGLFWRHFEPEGRNLSFAFGAPHEGRGHRRGVRLFVNGRPVQDRLLFRALMEGYRGLLASDRNPVALLWLRLPPDEVDVNVHPAKREVRFRDEGRVFRWVAGCVAEALADCPWGAGERRAAGRPAGLEGESGPEVASRRIEGVAEAVQGYTSRARSPADLPLIWAPRQGTSPSRYGRTPTGESLGAVPPLGCPEPAAGRFGALRYVGSFDATYLLFEDTSARELVLLDQHAAHERLLYEALIENLDGGAPQPLLFPVTLECSPAEMVVLEARQGDLEALGFRAAAFGPRSVAVSEAPRSMTAVEVEAAVRDLLADDDLLGARDDVRSRRESAAARAACAAAVKAKTSLLPSEAQELLGLLEHARSPAHCPHGRPALLRLSRLELEKMFHRK